MPRAQVTRRRSRTAARGRETTSVTLSIGGQRLWVVSQPMVDENLHPRLTTAENELLVLLRSGASNRAIAESRGTSEATVSKQLDSIYKKLRVGSRHEAVLAVSPNRATR